MYCGSARRKSTKFGGFAPSFGLGGTLGEVSIAAQSHAMWQSFENVGWVSSDVEKSAVEKNCLNIHEI